MDIKKTLQIIGLSKNEAAVYIALLESGLTQAGLLVKTTRLHRMLVYNALERLINEGLATVTRKKNIQLYQATDPSILVDKTRRTHQLAKQLTPE